MKVAVYRHIDAAGRTLYIGASADPTTRFAGHRSSSKWAFDVVRIEVTWFADRPAALAEEARLIRTEKPPFNKEWQRSNNGNNWGANRGHLFFRLWMNRECLDDRCFAERSGIPLPAVRPLSRRVSYPQAKRRAQITLATDGYVPREVWGREFASPLALPSDQEAAKNFGTTLEWAAKFRDYHRLIPPAHLHLVTGEAA